MSYPRLTSSDNVKEHSREEHSTLQDWITKKNKIGVTSALIVTNEAKDHPDDEYVSDYLTHRYSATTSKYSLMRYLTTSTTSTDKDSSMSRKSVTDATEGVKSQKTAHSTSATMANATGHFKNVDLIKDVTLLLKNIFTETSNTALLNKAVTGEYPSTSQMKILYKSFSKESTRHYSLLTSKTTRFSDGVQQQNYITEVKSVAEKEEFNPVQKKREWDGDATTLALYVKNTDRVKDESSVPGGKHVPNNAISTKSNKEEGDRSTNTMPINIVQSPTAKTKRQPSATFTGIYKFYFTCFNDSVHESPELHCKNRDTATPDCRLRCQGSRAEVTQACHKRRLEWSKWGKRQLFERTGLVLIAIPRNTLPDGITELLLRIGVKPNQATDNNSRLPFF